MQIHYLEIVTKEVDAVCAALRGRKREPDPRSASPVCRRDFLGRRASHEADATGSRRGVKALARLQGGCFATSTT